VISLASIKAQASALPELMIPADAACQHLGGSMCGGIGDPYTYYPNLWAWAVGLFHPTWLLDVGCGHGYATRFFKELRVPNVLGIDGDQAAIAYAAKKDQVIAFHDFAKDRWRAEHSVSTDMIWCCEFLEHLEEKHLDNLFPLFGKSKTIFITHATPGQGGHHHVNEQPTGYWVLQFMKRGFVLDENLTACARLVAAADKHLLGLQHDTYFMKTGLVFHNTNV
jgi:SAM-dependent methyltransferase